MGFRIRKSKILLVEGSHEESFFKELLKFMTIQDIQVGSIGGKYNFRPNLKNLPSDNNFHVLDSLGIIRDADDNFEETLKSIQDSLQDAGLPVPQNVLQASDEGTPKVTIFIMPDNKNGGNLEKLCLDSIQDRSILGCINEYFKCRKQENHPKPHKAKVQAYLACMPEGDIHMGRAAQRNHWDWKSPAFGQLKEFLEGL